MSVFGDVCFVCCLGLAICAFRVTMRGCDTVTEININASEVYTEDKLLFLE